MTPRRPSVSRALSRSLKARQLQPWEEAPAALARRLAQEIDAADDPLDISRLSARLTTVLTALGMTRTNRPPTPAEDPDWPTRPRGVSAGGGPAATALERIRAARAGQRHAPAVDPTTEGPE